MNVFILSDLEGIKNVTDIDYMDREGEKYQQARHELSDTIARAIRTCREAGAENVWYQDGHGGGGNVFEDEITGAIKTDMYGLDELLKQGKVDCLIELGVHARAGTVGGFLDHTINSRRWFKMTVNGREYNELAIHAAYAGCFGVPVVFCSGDVTACRQAREYVPDIFTAPIKEASTRNRCRMFDDPDGIVDRGLREALANYKRVPPMPLSFPATVKVTYYRTDFCEEDLARLGDTVTREDARTLSRTVTKLNTYYDLKF